MERLNGLKIYIEYTNGTRTKKFKTFGKLIKHSYDENRTFDKQSILYVITLCAFLFLEQKGFYKSS